MWSHRIDFIEDDVLASDLPPDRADFAVSTFGLKTFKPEQHTRLAALIARVLRPGGTFALIEASDPRGWWLRPLYLLHLKVILPLIERVLLRGAQDFAMIGTYTANVRDASELAAMLRAQGLEVEFTRYLFGCATGVSGRKVGSASQLRFGWRERRHSGSVMLQPWFRLDRAKLCRAGALRPWRSSLA
jgi:ubiquinone/menaquinone biosynthesis C-methylase UbiE